MKRKCYYLTFLLCVFLIGCSYKTEKAEIEIETESWLSDEFSTVKDRAAYSGDSNATADVGNNSVVSVDNSTGNQSVNTQESITQSGNNETNTSKQAGGSSNNTSATEKVNAQTSTTAATAGNTQSNVPVSTEAATEAPTQAVVDNNCSHNWEIDMSYLTDITNTGSALYSVRRCNYCGYIATSEEYQDSQHYKLHMYDTLPPQYSHATQNYKGPVKYKCTICGASQ